MENMKKRLRFLMPHTPLKVLRGNQDEYDVRDKYYERFKPPPTTTDEDNDDSASDDYSDGNGEDQDGVRAQLLNNDADVDHDGDDIITRTTNRNTNSVESLIQPNYNTTGSVSQEAIEMQAVAQIHFVPNVPLIHNDEDDENQDDGDRYDEHTML